MKVCYLILSHKQPGQLLRLVGALRDGDPDSEIVIHHDLKAVDLDVAVFEPYSVRLIPDRVSVVWGDFSMVQSMLTSFKWMLKNINFDWVFVLSGQDYPIRPLNLVGQELSRLKCDAHINGRVYDVPGIWPEGLGLSRYFFQYVQVPRNNYYYLIPEILRNVVGRTRKLTNSSQGLVRLYPRYLNRPPLLGIRSLRHPFSDSFRCYVGSQWFDARKACIEYIVDFSEKNARMVGYYRRTMIPDESFFMTILYNCHLFKIENDNKRYVNWSSDNNASSPLAICMDDLPKLFSSGKYFARKFDFDSHPAVLDAVDGYLKTIR